MGSEGDKSFELWLQTKEKKSLSPPAHNASFLFAEVQVWSATAAHSAAERMGLQHKRCIRQRSVIRGSIHPSACSEELKRRRISAALRLIQLSAFLLKPQISKPARFYNQTGTTPLSVPLVAMATPRGLRWELNFTTVVKPHTWSRWACSGGAQRESAERLNMQMTVCVKVLQTKWGVSSFSQPLGVSNWSWIWTNKRRHNWGGFEVGSRVTQTCIGSRAKPASRC